MPGYRDLHLLFALMLALFCFASGSTAFARSHLIESVAVMEDPTNSLGVEEVALGDFQPASDTISLGYSSSTQWLRIRILPAPDGEDAVLLFGAGAPDSLKLFAPVSGPMQTPATRSDGARHEELLSNWPSPQPGFRINPPEGGAEYFAQIKSMGSIRLHMTAQPATKAIVTTERRYLAQVVYLTSMFVIMLWALHMFTVTRLHLFGWFVALQFSWLANNIFYLGYARDIVPTLSNETHALLFRASVFVAAFLTALFHRAVMARFEPATSALRLFNIQLGVIAIAFIAFWSDEPVLAMQINAACLAAFPFVFFANAVTAQKNIAPGLFAIRVIYGAISLSFFLNAFTVLGLIHSQFLVQYGYLIHGVTTSILIIILLKMKVADMFATARSAKLQRAEMERQNAIEQEKTRALSQFIDMLGHEARNALAVIQMSTSAQMLSDGQRARSDQAIRGLTNVIDRCNQVIRLDNSEQILSLEVVNVTEMLQKLCSRGGNAARIKLEVQGPVFVQGDPVLLDVVFCNLLDNALKYSPSGSAINVSLTSEDAGHSILFENAQGPAGMPDPEHVFEKYYRSKGARADIGSGLGLYIVRGLLHLMDGKVYYVPRGNHIRFKVCFPC